MRALLAQMIELQRGAAVTKDAKLARLATDFQLYLATIAQAKTFNPTEMAKRAQGLLALLPKDDPGRDQAA